MKAGRNTTIATVCCAVLDEPRGAVECIVTRDCVWKSWSAYAARRGLGGQHGHMGSVKEQQAR